MSEKSEVLLPYCNKCGEYKGIGLCKTCNSIGPDPKVGRELCSRCNELMEIQCTKCGSSFCSNHSQGIQGFKVINRTHFIGTCIRCGVLVCEDCWILDELGRIICLEHLEEDR